MSWSAKAVWAPGSPGVDVWSPTDFSVAEDVADAIDPIEHATADAYDRGFAAGRAEGERAERARLRTAMRAAEEAGEIIDASNERWTGAAEENVTALAIAVARHIVDRELSVDPPVIAKLVSRALAEFPIDQPLRIRLNPDDLAVVQTLDDAGMREMVDHTERVTRWISDARVMSGGCVVEGRDKIVDGRVETALERVYRRLTHNHA